jgi:hypothetical protein
MPATISGTDRKASGNEMTLETWVIEPPQRSRQASP